MQRSDIFDSFTKIALEKGIIKESSPEELQKKLEENPRADSLDISAIEALYGIKPNTPKDMEYKRNIIEDAHPNAVIVSPSYDKLNGLVENLNERQDILLHIVNKTPDGHLTQHKYAEKEFILSLVRLGNHLDNTGKDGLRILADTCLQQATDEIKKKDHINKQAAAPLVIGIVVAVAAVIGGLYAQQHLPFINDGFEKNHEKLVAEIDDMLNDQAFVYGNQYTANFLKQLQEFKGKLTEFYTIYQQTKPIIENIEEPKTAQELILVAQKPQTQVVRKAYDLMRQKADDMLPYLNAITRNFSSEAYKIRQIEDKGWLQKAVDYTRIFHGGKGLVADDFDDVVRAIPPYTKSISDMLGVFNSAKTLEDNAKSQLTQAAATSQKEFGVAPKDTTKSEPTPVPDNSNPTMFASQNKTVEQQAAGLEQEMKDLGLA